jgi:hypothetical protein
MKYILFILILASYAYSAFEKNSNGDFVDSDSGDTVMYNGSTYFTDDEITKEKIEEIINKDKPMGKKGAFIKSFAKDVDWMHAIKNIKIETEFVPCGKSVKVGNSNISLGGFKAVLHEPILVAETTNKYLKIEMLDLELKKFDTSWQNESPNWVSKVKNGIAEIVQQGMGSIDGWNYVHIYEFPILSILNKVKDYKMTCFRSGTIGVTYFSDVIPWDSIDFMAQKLNPEIAIMAGLVGYGMTKNPEHALAAGVLMGLTDCLASELRAGATYASSDFVVHNSSENSTITEIKQEEKVVYQAHEPTEGKDNPPEFDVNKVSEHSKNIANSIKDISKKTARIVNDTFLHTLGCSGNLTIGTYNSEREGPMINALSKIVVKMGTMSNTTLLKQTIESILNAYNDEIWCAPQKGIKIRSQFLAQVVRPLPREVFLPGISPAKWATFLPSNDDATIFVLWQKREYGAGGNYVCE